MNVSLYKKHPVWGIGFVMRMAARRLRGMVISCVYSSGGGLKVGRGATFDCPNIIFGCNVVIGSNVKIFGLGQLIIGNNVQIGDGTVICVADNIAIGSDTLIAAQCYITDCNHGIHLGQLIREQPMKVKRTSIGSDVWIGCGCYVLAGAVIREGVVLGAGTVVDGEVLRETVVIPDRSVTKICRH